MAYDRESRADTSSGSSSDSPTASVTSEGALMHRLMELMRAYGNDEDTPRSSVRVSA